MQNEALALLTLENSRHEIGVRELTGHNDGARIRMYQNFVGHGLHGAPYCACEVSFCMALAAKKLGIHPKLQKTASSQDFYEQGVHHGLILKTPVVGCIGLLRSPGSHHHHHTFLVESVDLHAGVVHSIDANWSNQVKRTTHPIGECDFVAVA